MTTQSEDVAQADALVRGAHARAYRYPESFEGFRATLAWSTDTASGSGTVVAQCAPEIEVSLEAGAREADASWIERELRSIVGHRRFTVYDAADGAHEKSLSGGSRVLGELVELGDSLDSSYRVAGGEISTVTRTMAGKRFTIVVHEREAVADGRTVPVSFTVFFWDAESGAITATEAYRDEVAEVDGVFLPAVRRVVRGDDTGLSVRELALSDHALLGLAVAR